MSAQNVIVKIHDFDENSKSLIVSVTSDTSPILVDDAPQMAFQPTMFDETNPEMVVKKIAQMGVSISEEQDKKFALSQNTTTINLYKDKVGQTYTFNVVELYHELYGSNQQNTNIENINTES